MVQLNLLPLFDQVMRTEQSQRGMNISETCRLLSDIARQHTDLAPYEQIISDLEDIYLEQFLHTCLAIPDFAKRVHSTMSHYKQSVINQ